MSEEKRGSILFVEDDESILEVIAIFLREDYAVTTAARGDTALECFREGSFDLVISDVRMPGLDGIGLFREVRRLRPGQKFIFTSVAAANEDNPEVRQILTREADGFVGKPYRAPELVKLVDMILGPQ